jgi:hypothetical protein
VTVCPFAESAPFFITSASAVLEPLIKDGTEPFMAVDLEQATKPRSPTDPRIIGKNRDFINPAFLR